MAKDRRHVLRTYTLEEKIALVTKIDQLYRAGGISLKAAANAAGTSETSYSNWLRAGIKPRKALVPEARSVAPRPYSPDERVQLLAEVERQRAEGLGILAACRAVGISSKSYQKWRDDQAAPAPMRPVEVTALVPVAQAALTLAPPRPAAQEVAAPAAAGALVLVAPGGYRLEGLGVETAAALLRALA